jgi:hypothetical protein
MFSASQFFWRSTDAVMPTHTFDCGNLGTVGVGPRSEIDRAVAHVRAPMGPLLYSQACQPCTEPNKNYQSTIKHSNY